MEKVFLDTNVAADFVIERKPWFDPAASIIELGNRKRAEIYCSTITFSTLSYLMERCFLSPLEIVEKLRAFQVVCYPLPADIGILNRAYTLGFSDFEDAMQYATAETINADVIITRDRHGFDLAKIPVLTPDEYLDRGLLI